MRSTVGPVLLAVLVALVVIGLLDGRLNPLRGPSSALSSSKSAACPVEGAPEAPIVGAAEIDALRTSVAGLAAFTGAGQAYEEGPVGTGVIWSDGEPGTGGVPAGSGPAGFEMRWWTPSGDDLVADAWRLQTAAAARGLVARAGDTACRDRGLAFDAPHPPDARNLQWRNPEGVVQQDVFFQTGRDLYRVSIVTPGAEGEVALSIRDRAFETIDSAACLLAAAGCEEPSLASRRGGEPTRNQILQ